MQRRLIATALAVLLGGCAGHAVDVLSKADPNYDFKAHRTYNWLQTKPSQTLPPEAMNPTELDAEIHRAVDEGLKNRGYHLSDSPELLITYQVLKSDRIPASSDPPPAAWDPSTDITKYASAALVLDLMIANSHERVWRGGALTDVQKGQGHGRVPEVVDKLLQDLPSK